MRLKHIKLAGFKSFVDLTSVPFEHSMTAIVGPNGCGKSNIIDAVRWVLGESSAKNLRGDSMTDVIFNGSTARKPVGQASVELVFDNRLDRLQGSMADRNEISIRRVVNRDAQNTYYLNGSKCRRKDITDIFLGTGLGPRSYAIIEQGMISKLIESKPQELRVFIEEAAGVSKYKERRRETETRIRHTRENLSRLADIRLELSNQIAKLDGQAQSALRFKTLKAKERALKAEVTVLRWQHCQNKIQTYDLDVLKLERDIEQLLAQQTSIDLAKIDDQLNQQQRTDDLTKLQQKKLNLTSHISRLEQNVKHAKQKSLTLEQDIEKITENIADVSEHIQFNSVKKNSLQKSIDLLQPKITTLEADSQQMNAQLNAFKQREKTWQQQWNNYQQQQTQFSQQTKLLEVNISSADQVMNKTEQRIANLTQNIARHDVTKLQAQYDSKLTVLNENKHQKLDVEQHIDALTQQVIEIVHQLEQCREKKSSLLLNIQDLTSQIQTLESFRNKQEEWQLKQEKFLTAIGDNDNVQLIEHINVIKGWEPAVDTVLGHWLQSSVVQKIPNIKDLSKAKMTLQSAKFSKKVNPKTLAACITGTHPFTAFLNTILIVETSDEAYALADKLLLNQSVITKDGLWLGDGWLQKGSFEKNQEGLSQRALLKQLNDALIESKNKDVQLDIQTTQLQSDHTILEESRQKLQQRATRKINVIEKTQQELVLLEQEISLKNIQVVAFKEEMSEQKNAYAAELKKYQELLNQIKQVQDEHHNDVDLKQKLQDEKATLEKFINEKQTLLDTIESDHQTFTLELEKKKVESIGIQNAIDREQQQLIRLLSQQELLFEQQHNNQLPMVDSENQLSNLITQSNQLDDEQLELNLILKNLNFKIEKSAVEQKELNIKLAKERDKLSKQHVDIESFKVRSNAAIEQLIEMQQNLDEVVTRLPIDAKENQWQLQLTKISKDISALGAINLAAIEEFTIQVERKQFLDKQNADLESAISTLESAIHKIDKETKQKFKTTFDQVNGDLKLLFPKVFGGGNAYLELVGDDLLDAGVTIMARPPGKKNSTIHLLSGGEKALTALSLVFAIFRLNPAPFCMLDEVDAPLDDANVGRFCKLVEEMSKTVQFIYISHNKIAMEMASHLTGVTMHEPGVSRMVAVDIDEAVAMAEAV